MSDNRPRRSRGRSRGVVRSQLAQAAAASALDAAARRTKTTAAEIVITVGVVVVVIALCMLIWLLAVRGINEQRSETRDRAEQIVTGHAATLAEAVGHEFALVDQSLTIIQQMWRNDSDTVNLSKLQATMPALTAVTGDLFIADEKHIVEQDILPQAVGQGIGAAYVPFPHGSLEEFLSDGSVPNDFRVVRNDAGGLIDGREFLVYIIRPLDHPRGWLVGAAFRSDELPKLFARAKLGFNPIAGLIDIKTRRLQDIIGPGSRHPNIDLSNSSLVDVMARTEVGTWIGKTDLDDVERIHAFHRVPGRNSSVLVGISMSELSASSDRFAAGVRTVAAAATVVVVAIGGMILFALANYRTLQRRRRTFDRTRGELERLRGEDANHAARTAMHASRLKILMDNIFEGIALFDADHRLIHCNRAFNQACEGEPQPDQSLDAVIRQLSPCDADNDEEVQRRLGLIVSADPDGVILVGPAQQALHVLGFAVPEGGLLLRLTAVAAAPVPAGQADKTVEW